MPATTHAPITSPPTLESTWTELMGPLPHGSHSLWLMLIGPDDRPLPTLAQVTDTAHLPDPREQAHLTTFVRSLVDDGWRIAFLVARPGRDEITDSDRAWARILYDACRAGDVACDVVHRANDVDVRPVTADDLVTWTGASPGTPG